MRTRTYTHTRETLVEVKLEGVRGATVKERMSYPVSRRHTLDEIAQSFVADVLDRHDMSPVTAMDPMLTTSYTRSTLVDAGAGARLTLDVDLRFDSQGKRRRGPDLVPVESKSSGTALAETILAERGIRPVRASKYCIGLALTRPWMPTNRWNRLLRREFGWERCPSIRTGDRTGHSSDSRPTRA